MKALTRKPGDIAVFTLRLREKLRDRLEREATKHQTSMNDEIIRRLEASFQAEEIVDVVKTTIKTSLEDAFHYDPNYPPEGWLRTDLDVPQRTDVRKAVKK